MKDLGTSGRQVIAMDALRQGLDASTKSGFSRSSSS